MAATCARPGSRNAPNASLRTCASTSTKVFNPSRAQVRQFFFDVWAKYRAGQPLAGAEQPALDAVLAHPEYHALLDKPDRYIERDYLPESGETNPFLHQLI